MKTKLLSLLSVLVICIAVAGCTTTQKQATGILGGGVAGGVIGSAVTGGSAVGAVVGAAGGAYAGHVIAKHYQ